MPVGDVVIVRKPFTFTEKSDNLNLKEVIGTSVINEARFDAMSSHIEINRTDKEGIVYATLITTGIRRVLP